VVDRSGSKTRGGVGIDCMERSAAGRSHGSGDMDHGIGAVEERGWIAIQVTAPQLDALIAQRRVVTTDKGANAMTVLDQRGGHMTAHEAGSTGQGDQNAHEVGRAGLSSRRRAGLADPPGRQAAA
jgi:hypothetical protein